MPISEAVALTVQVWSVSGLHASQFHFKGGAATYIVCSGVVCEKKTIKVPAVEQLTGAPDFCLVCRLLKQPVALLAVGGMLFLTYCCAVESVLTNLALSLVNGRTMGWFILAAACIAHLAEAAYAVAVCRRLGFSPGATARWVACCALVGYPVLQFVLKLDRISRRSLKAAE